MELKQHLIDSKINFDEVDGKIYVGGGLYLRGTQITALPDGLSVGGGIYR